MTRDKNGRTIKVGAVVFTKLRGRELQGRVMEIQEGQTHRGTKLPSYVKIDDDMHGQWADARDVEITEEV